MSTLIRIVARTCANARHHLNSCPDNPTGPFKIMTTDPDRAANRNSNSDANTPIELPLRVAQRMMAQLRRVRWLLVAMTVVVCVLLVSGRINLHEAIFTFGFLALTALLSGTPTVVAGRGLTSKRSSAARAAAQQASADKGIERLIAAWPQAVVVVDQRAVIHSINALASDLLDIRQPGDPLSFKLRDPEVLSAVQRALDEGREETCTLIEKVPAERKLLLHIRPFGDDLQTLGNPARARFVLMVIEDETDAHRVERMRSDFVANASHELRTPLASITGCIETLQGAAKNDPIGQERFLRIMDQQAGRMTALIDDLLSLNRIEMQAHRRPADTVDLADMVREALDIVRPASEEAGVEMLLDVPGTPTTVRGDAGELRQVAANLLQNAIKYGASGKRVDVSLRDALEGGVRMVELRVQDHGPGIAEEDLPRLTERFYRAHEETNPLATGTGLGLAIVKHIIARHRGRLFVESTLGEGASFAIRVPYQTDSSHLQNPSENPSKNQSVTLSHE